MPDDDCIATSACTGENSEAVPSDRSKLESVEAVSTPDSLGSDPRDKSRPCAKCLSIVNTNSRCRTALLASCLILLVSASLGACLLWMVLKSSYRSSPLESSDNASSTSGDTSSNNALRSNSLAKLVNISSSERISLARKASFRARDEPDGFAISQNLVLEPSASFSAEHHSNDCNSSMDFRCSNGDCFPSRVRCNKVRDCHHDGDDELNCTCRMYLLATAAFKICDGIPDCVDFSDEADCQRESKHLFSSVASCSSNYFSCGLTKECIPLSQVCDGRADCLNANDEKDCLRLSNAPAFTPNYKLPETGFVSARVRGVWSLLCFSAQEIPNRAFLQYVCQNSGYNKVAAFSFRSYEAVAGSSPIASRLQFGLIDQSRSFLFNFRKALRVGTSCDGFLLNLSCSDFSCASTTECQSTTNRRPRIIGGEESGAWCFPWAAALYMVGDFKCMGVLLNKRWLATAAHCFPEGKRRKFWVARLGVYRQFSESPFEELRVVDRVIRHPDYADRPIYTNDIALLRLASDVPFSAYIHPPCLPEATQEDPAPATICTVVGWGAQDEEGDLPFSDELLKTTLTVISKAECNASSQAYYHGHIRPTHLCLSHENQARDACAGDSGGPLMCRGPRRFGALDASAPGRLYFAGITSQGQGCAQNNTPAVWASVAHHMAWISEQLASNQLGGLRVGEQNSCQGFRCRLGQCLYSWWRCNGHYDCGPYDLSDEENCSSASAMP